MPEQLTPETIARLTATISVAGMDGSAWGAVVEELSRISGGVRTHLFGHDHRTRRVLFESFANYDPAHMRAYLDHFWRVNPRLPVIGAAGICEIRHSLELVPREDLLKTEFYGDWVRHQEDSYCGGGTTLFSDEDRFVFVGGDIRARDQERLEDNWCRILELVTPHLRLALEMNRTLDRHLVERIGRVPEQRQAAVMVIAADGQLIHANDTATDMLDRGDPLALDFRRRVELRRPGGPRLADMPAQLGRDPTRPGGRFVLRDASGAEWQTQALVLDPRAAGFSPVGILGGHDGSCLVLTLAAKDEAPSRAARIGQRLGLTLAEAEVVLALTRGMTPEEIAKARHVSIHTIRNQVKSALSKTGSRRQAELVAAVMRHLPVQH